MADGFRGIPGVPDGWELVRIDSPVYGEFYLDNQGNIQRCEYDRLLSRNHVILRKIEKPKQWRPFASAEEFKPHRDRWVRRVLDGLVFRCTSYGGGALVQYGSVLPTFSEAFVQFVFDDDGTPFGVEVTDGE
jgi:hypothetical protein